MKTLLMMAFVAFISTSCDAQNSRKSPHETVSSDNISVTYGRPYAKGRDVFGGLEKFGKVWRVGADEATEITFKKDAVFGGTAVKAGTYTLFAIPEEKEWTLILNSELKQWGAYNYEKIKDKNVATLKAPTGKTIEKVEQLTITPTDDGLVIAWDDTIVDVPFSLKK